MTNSRTDGLDAVLFDFDGVLVESLDLKIRAYSDLYESHGPAVVAKVAAGALALTGITRRIKIREFHWDLLGIDLGEAELDHLCDRFADMVIEDVVAAPWVAGALECLRDQAPRRPLFVISGTPDGEMKEIVERRGMNAYFTEVHGGPTGKDVIIEDIIARHGFDRGRLLMLGDGRADFEAAEKTGVGFLGRVAPGANSPFPDGTDTVPDLKEL